jgi:hypothetical protein
MKRRRRKERGRKGTRNKRVSEERRRGRHDSRGYRHCLKLHTKRHRRHVTPSTPSSMPKSLKVITLTY